MKWRDCVLVEFSHELIGKALSARWFHLPYLSRECPALNARRVFPPGLPLRPVSQFALGHPSFSSAIISARGTPLSLTKWSSVQNTSLLLLNSDTTKCSSSLSGGERRSPTMGQPRGPEGRGWGRTRGKTCMGQGQGPRVEEEWVHGPSGWGHLFVETEGQSIRKGDNRAGPRGRVGAGGSQFPQHWRIWKPGRKMPSASSIPHLSREKDVHGKNGSQGKGD